MRIKPNKDGITRKISTSLIFSQSNTTSVKKEWNKNRDLYFGIKGAVLWRAHTQDLAIL